MLNHALQGTYQVITHAGCICNERAALHNRHLVDRSYIPFDQSYFMKCARKVNREFAFQGLAPCKFHDIISRYTGPKRQLYLRALDDIRTYGFDHRWAHIKMFVKPDKFPFAKAMVKPPRAIQYRSPAFNLLLAHYLKPIEDWFYNSLSPGGFRFAAKGLNNVQRAINLKEMSSTFDNPAYILLDHSSFDSTINETHLRTTHKFYTKLNNSSKLKMLLKFQLNNKGWSKHGIKYMVKGTRMSGDFDTALGNTYINYVALRSWLRLAGVRGEIMLDGDDSVVIVERSSMYRLDMDHFGKCGFETKMEVVYDLVDVEFCQSKYLPTEPPRFSRNPIRALSRLNISVKNYHGSGWRRYQSGIGHCEMAVNQGVPILYPIGLKLARLSKRPIFDTEMEYKVSSVEICDIPITDEVRVAFYQAWGISPYEQIAIESEYTPHIRAPAVELIQSYFSLPEDEEK